MCDTMVRVTDEGVLFAKNSDRDPNEAQLLDWQPARDHAAGAAVTCTWITIPQAAHTHAVLLSRPFWMWGAEMGANQHGVVIGNEAVFTDQPYADTGLTGMDLLRLALERSTTAEEAVETIVTLLERHGQGGGCGHEDRGFTYHNSFIAADPSGAVVLETAGQRWAIEGVDHGARSISNGLTIPAFAASHADRLRGWVARCDARRSITQSAAAGATGPLALMTALRGHGPGRMAPRWSWINGAMSAPAMQAGGLLASSQTTASWVSDLTSGRRQHWATATAAPDTSVFKPVLVSEPVDLGPPPTDGFDPATLWWRHELLHRAVARDPAKLSALYTGERDELERRWIADPPDSATAFAEADEVVERWTTAVRGAWATDVRPWYARRYWRIRDRRAGVPTAAPTG